MFLFKKAPLMYTVLTLLIASALTQASARPLSTPLTPASLSKRGRAIQQAGAQQPCVCAFDFDGTLHKSSRLDTILFFFGLIGASKLTVGEEAASAMNSCLDAGFKLAVATQNCNDDGVQAFFEANFENVTVGVGFEEFFDSGAFQHCDITQDKSDKLEDIAEFYETAPECMVLIDDSSDNKKGAEKAGVPFQKVDKSVGVTLQDSKAAQEQVTAGCNCLGSNP